MNVLIFTIGIITGIILNILLNYISNSVFKNKKNSMNILIPAICGLAFEILFLRFKFTAILYKGIVMTAVLIIISFIDIRYKVINDFMVFITLILGIIFSFVVKASFIDMLFGIIAGGGIMFLLALIPGAIGGGDIKLMFGIGAFLGLYKTLWALILAFIISSIISLVLILFKIKGTKDYIPFGPFLSLGSFISLILIK